MNLKRKQLNIVIRSQRSNAILSSVLFICILSALIKISLSQCFYENKLNCIFIQESQVAYISENLFHLGRDYAYRLTTTTDTDPDNPNPNILFTPRCFQKGTTAGIINFNTCFGLGQLLPAGFPVTVTNASLTGGPVFFNDAKTDSNDERYKAEIFLASQIQINSAFIPNWVSYGVQLFEVERNPLCDFQIFCEGDSSVLHTGTFNLNKPIFVNGNFRFLAKNNIQCFYGGASLAGHYLVLGNSSTKAGKPLPNDAPGRSYNEIYNYSSHNSPHSFITFSHADHITLNNSSLNANFESMAFDLFGDALKLRQRNVRPSGFDPSMYNSIWHTADPKPQQRILETTLGAYGLVDNADVNGANLYSSSAKGTTNTALSSLRGLSTAQAEAKIKLVESQKAIGQPGTVVVVRSSTQGRLLPLAGSSNAERFPYVLHYPQYADISPSQDTKALMAYLQVVLSGHSTIDTFEVLRRTPNTLTTSSTFGQEYLSQEFVNGKLFYRTMSTTTLLSQRTTEELNIYTAFLKTRKSETDNNGSTEAPPFLIEYDGTNWGILGDERENLPSHPIFIYDKNRRRWIQLIDFDIAELRKHTSSISGWNGHIHFARDTLGSTNFYNGLENNYKDYNNSGIDIRTNYRNRRKEFLGGVPNGLPESTYTYPWSHPTGVGIRIINGEQLPTGGLTISASLPVYVQGNFNITSVQTKAAIHADSITVLPKKWQDWTSDFANNSAMNPLWDRNESTIIATINAHLVTGTPHPDYACNWLEGTTWNGIPETGWQGGIRLLDKGIVTLGGCLILPFRSKIQWEPWVHLNIANANTMDDFPSFTLATTWFSYNDALKTSRGMPFYHRVSRGRKTRMIGETDYNNLLNNIVNTTDATRDWDSTNTSVGTQNQYRNLLPRYLQ